MLLAPLLLFSAPPTPAPSTSLIEPGPVQEAAAAPARGMDSRTRINILLGGRAMDDETYWEPLDNPFALEASVEWRLRDSFVGFEVGTSIAYDDTSLFGVDVSATTWELFGGVRATADLADGHLRPYFGLGPSLIYTDVTGEQGSVEVSDDDTSFGLYLRAGVTWVFDGGFGLGFDYRKLLGTDVSLYGIDGDADFDQFALSLGFAF